MCDLSNPIFHDAGKAREWLESKLWPNGPICPHCGVVNDATLLHGKSHRHGLYQCNAKQCRKPFTVTVGTLYERSHVPLNKWLAATHLIMASKKGISALQVGRMLGVSKKTAWFLCHRIRESVNHHYVFPDGQIGGAGKTVEADETYMGPRADRDNRVKGRTTKAVVYSLVERGGRVRSFHIQSATAQTLLGIMRDQVQFETRIFTDDANAYKKARRSFKGGHAAINHRKRRYAIGELHTNSAENFFSIFKRGVNGVYQHISVQHLKRYLAEFAWRYSNREKLGIDDAMRMEKSIPGIVGKRLTYRRINQAGQV